MAMIQSSFGNLEVLVAENNQGVHYWRDHTGKWSKGGAFGNGVTEILGFVQSSFGHIGNFEAVVLENGSKTHYWRDNDAPGFPWHKTVTF